VVSRSIHERADRHASARPTRRPKLVRRVAAGAVLASSLGLLVGCGDSGSSGNNGVETNSPAESTFKVTGTDGLKFDPSTATVKAGTVSIVLTAGKAVNHDVVIQDVSKGPVVAAAAGKTKTGTVDLQPGTYTFYCDVPGHRGAGMEGTLTVN
jgi:uncharacterized cupredoxin-like copper-binding protein